MNIIDRLSRFSVTLAALVSLGALTGCEDNDFDPGSRVTSLRVLAQQADNPYARPGEAIHLTSLSHDPAERRAIGGGNIPAGDGCFCDQRFLICIRQVAARRDENRARSDSGIAHLQAKEVGRRLQLPVGRFSTLRRSW